MNLELRDVSKSFGMQQVLDSVTLAVAHGSRLAIVGASGSGKSTLLRVIGGFERPNSGTLHLDGQLLADATHSVAAHRRGIGYVAQDGGLFPHRTVRQNIGFGLRRGPHRESRVREMMDLTSLDAAFLHRYPHQLSGGQQQRVALARALAPAPSVILLDEPFSALDTGLRAHTRDAMIEALEQSGVTTILVTHDQEEALSFGQQLAIIADGRLTQSGVPADVFDAPIDAGTAEFLGTALFLPAHRQGTGRAVCGFGALPIRHDRARGADAVRAMIRPAQITVQDADDTANATVTAVHPSGSGVDLAIELRAPDRFTLVHRLPSHEADRFTAGAGVAVSVEGGVVLYPASTG
ncbi:MAG: ABC transporter ATP-binding protein [Microbacterium sp.]|uniref:ABC transporter ATP-binding protein n=1 Tax=Microbacterium sp. TaxID=51671 RepID=UPI003BB04B65